MTDTKILRKAMDRVQADVFISKNDAFLAPIMCQLNIAFDEDIETVCVTPHTMKWNPTWFMKLPEKTRNTVLIHELWHIGLMHELRRGNRDPKIWNFACVAKGTMIAMADGTQKPVETIKESDEIANLNSGTSTVGVKINSGQKPIYEIVLESGRILRCSGEHKVLTDEGFKDANSLTAGDSCFVDTRYGNPPERTVG